MDQKLFAKQTQRLLNLLGTKPLLIEDGDPGPLTEAALKSQIAKLTPPEDTAPIDTDDDAKPSYWKPGPYHPMFEVPYGFTHLHPYDVLRSVAGEKEIPGNKDNMLIAHFHEHAGNLGVHSEGADYHDEVPHCSSALNWAADASGCEKSNNALASSWESYGVKFGARKYKKGEIIPRGSIICIDGHVTLCNKEFAWTGNGNFEGFGSNQGNTIKTSIYGQSRIRAVHAWKPKAGTKLAPIGTEPLPASGNSAGESTR